MKKNALPRWLSTACLASLLLTLTASVHADQIWLSPTNGLWRDGTHWSGGAPPGGTNVTTVWITNAGSKVVTIDAATPSTNLLVTRLSLWAPIGSTNTLQMVDVTTNNPLTLS